MSIKRVPRPLLAYYREVSVDTVAVHAATIEEVTFPKVLKSGALQATDFAKDKTNVLLKFLGMKEPFTGEHKKSLAQTVIDRSEYWTWQGAESAVAKTLELLGDNLDVASWDLELLSTRLIEEAAQGLDISEDLLLSERAELIADKFLQDCVKGMQEVLSKQGKAESLLTEQLIARTLDEMSPAEKLQIQESLGIRELSGKTLRDVFLRSGLPIVGIATVQAGGFGAYLALTTVMHAVLLVSWELLFHSRHTPPPQAPCRY